MTCRGPGRSSRPGKPLPKSAAPAQPRLFRSCSARPMSKKNTPYRALGERPTRVYPRRDLILAPQGTGWGAKVTAWLPVAGPRRPAKPRQPQLVVAAATIDAARGRYRQAQAYPNPTAEFLAQGVNGLPGQREFF